MATARPRFVRWTHGLVNRLVRGLDVAILLLAPLLFLLPWGPEAPLGPLQVVLVALLQCWTYVAVLERLQAWRVESYEGFLAQLGHVLAGLLAAWGVGLLAMQAVRPGLPFEESWFWKWHGLQLLALLNGRIVVTHAWRAARACRLLRRRVVVVGYGSTAARVIAALEAPGRADEFALVGVFSHVGDPKEIGGRAVDGHVDALPAFAQRTEVDLVVLGVPWSRAPEIFQLQEKLQTVAADIVAPFDLDAPAPPHVRLLGLAGLPSLQLMSRPFKGSEAVAKVVEDYVVAAVALVLASPVMLLAALAIRLDSPGPVLFRQPRTGFGGQTFHILKFRTMTVDPADDGSVGTRTRHDPRITRVGGLLRRLSLDELPQLINVLRGEMSVVGPRPYVANMLVEDQRFADMVRTFAQRHRIKPGLTGWAQANGMRSAALRDPEKARRSVEMDIWYVLNWSLWLDVRIMARTLVVGLAGRNVF
ncbi:exopolysaccharide biosynthesis polyprenyl glycosylphosphotransferase [Roseococcus sp. DSY-14]|uniref:exopolysaccharide biosynthesis polyprenyl glycosylphosphotransferase n=1 Tax=Roseococcus sp. DSY-14 TaxID=3369650 RepID=UPI00387AF1ED